MWKYGEYSSLVAVTSQVIGIDVGIVPVFSNLYDLIPFSVVSNVNLMISLLNVGEEVDKHWIMVNCDVVVMVNDNKSVPNCNVPLQVASLLIFVHVLYGAVMKPKSNWENEMGGSWSDDNSRWLLLAFSLSLSSLCFTIMTFTLSNAAPLIT